MGSSKKDSKANKLTSLPGVGAASAKKLVDAKLDTISKVAAAGTAKLVKAGLQACLLYTSPSPRDGLLSRMPSSA